LILKKKKKKKKGDDVLICRAVGYTLCAVNPGQRGAEGLAESSGIWRNGRTGLFFLKKKSTLFI
jgi:hypothetical protein